MAIIYSFENSKVFPIRSFTINMRVLGNYLEWLSVQICHYDTFCKFSNDESKLAMTHMPAYFWKHGGWWWAINNARSGTSMCWWVVYLTHLLKVKASIISLSFGHAHGTMQNIIATIGFSKLFKCDELSFTSKVAHCPPIHRDIFHE